MTQSIDFGGRKTRARANLKALAINAELPEGCCCNEADRDALLAFSGWGCLDGLFDTRQTDWDEIRAEYNAVLDDDTFSALGAGALDSHYTDPVVIDAIWRALGHAGFQGGRALEPGCGAGFFRRFMPADLVASTAIVGVEKDPVAAGIARRLYPDMELHVSGYQDVALANDQFDAVIGNVPFGQQSVYDLMHRGISRFSIHNFFLAKSILKLRPGGIMAVVTSRHFLDQVRADAREYLYRHAEFLGAVRLPGVAFRNSARTDVVSDIVVFRRREEPLSSSAPLPSELGLAVLEGGGLKASYSAYYSAHPEQVVGALTVGRQRYGACISVDFDGDLAVLGRDVQARLANILPPGSFQVASRFSTACTSDAKTVDSADVENAATIPDGGYGVTSDGRAVICTRRHDEARFVDANLSGKRLERVVKMLGILEAVYCLLAAEAADDQAEMQSLRIRLNHCYDAFTSHYGPVRSLANRRLMRSDPRFPMLAALEDDFEDEITKAQAKRLDCDPRPPRWRKADIFNRPVNTPAKATAPTTPAEAVSHSLVEFGRIRINTMAGWLNISAAELVAKLRGQIFRDPQLDAWVPRQEYLSGNVRKKLVAAEAAAKRDPVYQPNIAALRGVIPEDIEAVDISAPMNAPWIPGRVIADFIEHLLGAPLKETPIHAAGLWALSIPIAPHATRTQIWGTERRPAENLIERMMNDKDLSVYDTWEDADGKAHRVLNVEHTAAANSKADEIREAWNEWLWRDSDRRNQLVRLYNDRFNCHVNTDADGSFLADRYGRLPGMNAALRLKKHQLDAIWHGISRGSALYDHVVGAGKTFAGIGTAMEQKRMGLVQKPMCIVPNHLVLQWAAEAQRMYPSAKILCAGSRDLKKTERQALFARIALNEWDLVIVPESAVKFINAPASTRLSMLSDMVSDISFAILESRDSAQRSVRDLERLKQRIEARMRKLLDAPRRDSVADFEELGVDWVCYDESQSVKNLMYFTSHSSVAGLGPAEGSQKAFDFFCKARYLQARNNGRGVLFLTGTPISNTVAEMFHNMRYLAYETLVDLGIYTFDAWARQFANPVSSYELGVSGNYQLKTRFSQFQNVPEMMAIYRRFAHVVTREDLLSAGSGWTVPQMRGGQPQQIIIPRSEPLAAYMDDILFRCDDLKGKDPREDNMLKIMSDARKAALDFRIIDPTADVEHETKVYECAKRILADWERTRADKGTQLVFCDLSIPSSGRRRVPTSSDDESVDHNDQDTLSAQQTAPFSVYDALKSTLVKMGIPEREIAFIHDANTDEQKFGLQQRVRDGRVRVLIGSTAKMGAGMNVQDRLVSEHHLDAPWRPSDLEQRIGRIIRPGSVFLDRDPDFKVDVYYYGTELTLDARMFQTLETKATFIEQVRKGSALDRVIKDIGGEVESLASFKSALSGNPLILAHFELERAIEKLELRYKAFRSRQMHIDDALRESENWKNQRDSALSALARDASMAKTLGRGHLVIDGQAVSNDQAEAMADALNRVYWSHPGDGATLFAKYRGLRLYCSRCPVSGDRIIRLKGEYLTERFVYRPSRRISTSGLMRRIDNRIMNIEQERQRIHARAESTRIDREKMLASSGQTFNDLPRLRALRDALRDVTAALAQGASIPPEGVDLPALGIQVGSGRANSASADMQTDGVAVAGNSDDRAAHPGLRTQTCSGKPKEHDVPDFTVPAGTCGAQMVLF